MRFAFRVVAVLVLLAIAAATALAVLRVEAATRPVSVRIGSRVTWIPAPGTAPVIPVPAQGSIAVDARVGSAVEHLAASDADTIRPIASVAKTMTALAILDVHPLVGAQTGPTITITKADVDDYVRIGSQGGSVAPVKIGEQLTERDLLLGLMLPSANNLALTAARWVDGTVGVFIARLNERAAKLGMTHTHFADPDGLDVATTSTATDLVLLGAAAVANDALLAVVSSTTAKLPDGTVVTNLDQLLGTEPGWIGVKTGWTPEASGCLLFAAQRPAPAGDPTVTIVGAVLGQPPDRSVDPAHPELGGAFASARSAVEAALSGYSVVSVSTGTIPIAGTVSTPWGDSSGVRLTGPGHDVLVRAGDTLLLSPQLITFTPPSPAGTDAGTVVVSHNGGGVVGTWTLVTATALDAPSPWWKLFNG